MEGARAYLFRAIFHDLPAKQCKQILWHTAAAMKPGYSKLLISELILNDHDVRLSSASLDMQMMALHGGIERTESQWRALIRSCGLQVTGIWQTMKGGVGVIEATVT